MNISLKQARRLEREIGTTLDQHINAGHKFGQLVVSIYENVMDKVTTTQTSLADDQAEFATLTRIRFAIRKAIETENEKGGLNTLMNREAELKALMKHNASMQTGELTDEELDLAIARHAALKANVEKGVVVQSRYGEATDTVTLASAVRTPAVEALKNNAKLMQRELLAVSDKLSALNAGREIQVSDEDVKTLEAAGIIV
jgi:hypothetical protein